MTTDIDECDVVSLPQAIAVIGMAGRFPGARTLDEFRRNLEGGVESITVFSDRELLQAGVDRSLLSNPAYVKAAPVLEDADRFDAAFFEYSPREAAIMDPQQRHFLECAWEALEDAGRAGDAWGSNTGVFSGAGGIMSTYLLSDTHFNPRLTGTTASLQHIGNDKDYLSTRVSYKLNLRGPSLAVQTACSTSLVAVHLACQSLLTGECDMALAGGTTVRVPQRTGYLFKEGNVFSADGHCRTFDADAKGTVFGSGIGVVVLKRLKDALRDRDPIRAVIRGTAIANDGSENKSSYWAPHAPGQADAMRRALAAARVDPRTIGYVEAHGTATTIGDPTEVRALQQAFGPMPGARCALGSVKSNIGHPESAAGVAGLIKAVLSLEHQVLFPSLNYSRPNPAIDFGDTFYVNTTRQPWPAQAFPRRAGVNSLGIGGTNAFVILEEAPARTTVPPDTDRPCHVLTLSAKSPEALDALAERYATHLAGQPDESIEDICFTAGAGRAHFAYRRAIVAASTEDAARVLASPDPSDAVLSGHVDGRPPRIAWLFTGQGSQYAGMARDLYRAEPVFRAAFDRCAEALSPHLPLPLTQVVHPDGGASSPIDDTAYTQPALFAVEYALASLWRSWGIEPSVLVGHSVGEIVAACVAGVMPLDDALRLTAERGRLMQSLPRDGAMAAIRCDASRVAAALAPYRDSVSMAAINGPADAVISGRKDHVEAIAAGFEREGVVVVRLKVSHAFHSPLMEPMLGAFSRVARLVSLARPSIPLVSNVTGAIETDAFTTSDYWVRHVRDAVRFADGVAAARAHGADVFLEIGPSPVLIGMARQTVTDSGLAWLPSLRPGRQDWRQLAESLAGLYIRGASIDWTAVDRHSNRSRVHLPTYPFQRQRFWIDPPAASAEPAGEARGSLLGRRLRLPGSSEIRFEARWSAHAPPYLDDHRIFDTVVVPGASHLAMALSGLQAASRLGTATLEDVVFPQALTLDDEEARTAQFVVKRDATGREVFEVLSLRDDADENEPGSWTVHATGRVSVRTREDVPGPRATDGERPARTASGVEFYERFWEAGYHLRGAFRWIANTWAGDGEILCELQWPELPDDPAAYPLYPSLIDACFQCVFSDRARSLLRRDAVYVPFSVRRLVFVESPRPGSRLWCHVAISQPDEAAAGRRVDADITLRDDEGRVLASIEGCQLREIRKDALAPAHVASPSDLFYEVEWQARPLEAAAPSASSEPGTWIVFADAASPVGHDLVERLRSRAARCIRVDTSPRFQALDSDHYQIDGASVDDMRRLIDEALGATPACRGIVHLWSLDAAPLDDAAGGASRARSCASVLHLIQALAAKDWARRPRLWLVTEGCQPNADSVQQAPLWGLGRVVALEHPELSCVRVDLDPADRRDSVRQLFDDVWAPDEQDQVAYRQAIRYVPRLTRIPASSLRFHDTERDATGATPFQIGLTAYGQFENLTARPLVRRSPGPGEVEIEVRAAGLNFRDVLNALGMLADHYAQKLGVSSASEMTFGFECSGTIASVGPGVSKVAVGDEVMAVASHEALGSFITLNADYVARKPAALTFEDAAVLPLAFLTAYHGLHTLAGLQRGERVLIHAAAGGVGLACVQWAQQIGAEVFATASPAKWEFLESLGIRHVMSSRTVDFAEDIQRATNGAGVHVVVNSLSGAFADASFDALARGGRFVELGKRGVWSDDEAKRRRPDASYLPFDLVEIAREHPSAIAAMLSELTRRLEAGTWTPPPCTAFPASQVADAFRYMAEARHVGKIAVTMPRTSGGQAGTTTSPVRGDGTYLITGGLGALGLKVAEWLAAAGARHLVLMSRRGVEAGTSAEVERLRQSGVHVVVARADVSDADHVRRVLTAIRDDMPPLRGIVHAAGILDDGVLLQQTWDRFERVLAPKVQGAWNLHAETTQTPLDFFICFSSSTSLVGNAGQGSYAAGNAFMDALVRHRRSRGLPALSVNWGPWDEAGMAAEGGESRRRRLDDQGFEPIPPEQGLDALSQLLRTDRAQVGVLRVDWAKFLRANPPSRAFLERVTSPAPAAAAARRPSNVRQRVADAPDPRKALADHVRSVVGTVLGIAAPQAIDARARLFDLGLESLMAVEMRGRFEDSLSCSLRPTLLFDYPTIEALVEHLSEKVIDARPQPAPAAQAPGIDSGAPASDNLEDMDEAELAERLARELWATTTGRTT